MCASLMQLIAKALLSSRLQIWMNQLLPPHLSWPKFKSILREKKLSKFWRASKSFFMAENLPKKLGVMLVVIVLVAILVLEPQLVECSFSIPFNPCTLPECIAQWKNILHKKFMSASCMITGSQGLSAIHCN